MADTAPPLFQFTTQEDWYGTIPLLNGDAGNAPLEVPGRSFEMWITPSTQGGTLVAPVIVLNMQTGGGLEFGAGGANTFVFRVPKNVATAFPRGDFTADLLEVVDGERHLFMPIRIRYNEPSGILSFLSRAFAVTYAASRQPIVTSIGVPGRQGSPGATIITGTVPPVPADGKDGDYWIEDRSASGLSRRMYGPKAGGAWPGTPYTIQVVRYQDVPGLTGALGDKAAVGHTAAPDADYTATVGDVQIGYAALTAPRTVTLPDVDTYPLGQVLFVADESGQCSVDRPITIAIGAGTGDTIAGQPAIQITDAYQGIGFRRGAANLWIIAR